MDTIFPETYRRKYQKLPSSIPPRRKLHVLKLGAQDPDHHRRWKLKNACKLKLRVFISPIRLLVKMREAYINMMLQWAKKMGTGRVSLSKRKHSQAMLAVGGQQVDARLVMDIYNRMVANRDQTEVGEHLDR